MQRLLAWLLRLYPRSFRKLFADDLLAVYRAERARLYSGPRARLRILLFNLRTLFALPAGLAYEWIRRPRPTQNPSSLTQQGGRTPMDLFDLLRTESKPVLRGLRRSPGFAGVVVLTLGLGIAANAAMFEIADQLLLRPPRYLEDPASVHAFTFGRGPADDRFVTGSISYPFLRELTLGIEGVRTIAAQAWSEQVAVLGNQPQLVQVMGVTASYWSLFDAPPTVGRYFAADEDLPPTGSPLAVLSNEFWRSRFASDPDVVGNPLIVGEHAYTVVGVTPPGFRGMELRPAQIFIPLTSAGLSRIGPDYADRPGTTWLSAYVRTEAGQEGAVLASSRQVLIRHFNRSWGEQLTQRQAFDTHLESVLPGRGSHPLQQARMSVWLLGMSILLLLIACANVCALTIGRALQHGKDAVVRSALGMRGGRALVAPLLETLLLAILAGVAAVPLAGWTARLMAGTLLPESAGAFTGLGVRTIGYLGILVLFAGAVGAMILFGFVRRQDLITVLRGTSGGSGPRSRAQRALPVVQAALSTILLIGAGLFVRSVSALASLDLGYEASRVLVADSRTSDAFDGFRPPEESGFTHRALREAALRVPGVEAAAVSSTVPFLHRTNSGITLPGGRTAPDVGTYSMNIVQPGYFTVVGTPLIRGRLLDDGDTGEAPPVTVVSRTLAQTLWPDGDPIGKRIYVAPDTIRSWHVVGVVEDTRRGDLRDPMMLQVYMPWDQHTSDLRGTLLVRTRARATGWIKPVREALQEVVPSTVLIDVQPLTSLVAEQYRTWTVGSRIFNVFGVLALLMAFVGLFSVIGYEVTRRRKEYGVRLALGAVGSDLVRLVLLGGLRMAAIGIGIGVLAAALLADSISDQLYAIGPHDPVTYMATGLLLLLSAGMASLLPAIRASRVAPQEVLKSD